MYFCTQLLNLHCVQVVLRQFPLRKGTRAIHPLIRPQIRCHVIIVQSECRYRYYCHRHFVQIYYFFMSLSSLKVVWITKLVVTFQFRRLNATQWPRSLLFTYQLKIVRHVTRRTLCGLTGLWHTVMLWVGVDVSGERNAAKLVVPFLRNFVTHLPDYTV